MSDLYLDICSFDNTDLICTISLPMTHIMFDSHADLLVLHLMYLRVCFSTYYYVFLTSLIVFYGFIIGFFQFCCIFSDLMGFIVRAYLVDVVLLSNSQYYALYLSIL